jgi:23S rRNA (cytidine1920-2'-O)/16S rRNA (cytidine1409-2'-O)-methyltransferase
MRTVTDPGPSASYVSRGGQKLAAALDSFQVDPRGAVCADLGSHVGGFVDCLLQHEAAAVHAVDTCYGTLAWKLRRNPRVVVHERTNALHFVPPQPVGLVTIDVGWTRQRLILESAGRMLAPGGAIITLIKPHYEAAAERLVAGVLPDEWLGPTVEEALRVVGGLGLRVAGTLESPLRGHAGNREVLAYLLRA